VRALLYLDCWIASSLFIISLYLLRAFLYRRAAYRGGSHFVGWLVSYHEDAVCRMQRCPTGRLLLCVQTLDALAGGVEKTITYTCRPRFTVSHSQPGGGLRSHVDCGVTDSADFHRGEVREALVIIAFHDFESEPFFNRVVVLVFTVGVERMGRVCSRDLRHVFNYALLEILEGILLCKSSRFVFSSRCCCPSYCACCIFSSLLRKSVCLHGQLVRFFGGGCTGILGTQVCVDGGLLSARG